MREGKNEKKENGSVKAKVKRALALLLVLTVIGTNYPAALQVKAASEGSSAAGTEAAWDDGAATEHTGDISSNEDTADTAPEDTAGNGTGADGLKTDSTDNAALSGTENSGSEEVTEGEYEAPQVYESTSIDQTNATDQLTLFIYQVRYQEKDAKEVIIKTEENAEHVYHVDLSALNVGKLKSLAVEVGFKIVPLMTEKKVKSGDTFQYAFPENVFSLENTKEPVPVMNRDGADNDIELDEQIAFYEIEDNIIKVTFTDTIDAETASHALGRIVLPVTLHQAAMSPESTTDAAIQLQKNDELDRKCVITLPKLEAAGEKAESETKNSAKDAGEEDKSSGVTKDEAVDGDVSSSESNENKSFFDEVKEGFQKRVAAFWGLFVAEKEESTTQKAIANPAPGISKVLIAATGKKEGYDNADADEQNRTFSFQMKIQADQDYLDKVFEDSSKDPNFPKMDNFGNEQNYAQAIEDYFTDNEKISPVSYTYSLGDDFKLPDGQSMPFERELKNEYTGETLGKIIFAEDANGLMTATVVFEKKIYAMIMEEVALTQSLVIKADRLSTDKQILGWTGEGLILKSSSGPVPSENPEDKKAQIVKAGKTNDTGTEFTYIIDVSAPASPAGSTLTGYTVKDILPQLPVTLPAGAQKYMNVDELLIDGDRIPLKPNADSLGYEIDSATGELKYTYSEDARSFSEITLKLSLTDEQIRAIDKAGAFNAKLENEATITAKDKEKPDNISNRVSNNVNYTALQKDCQEDPLSGNRYKWTLSVNTYNGRLLDDAYLIDVVDADVHVYTGAGVTISGNSTPYLYNELNKKDSPIIGSGEAISALNTVDTIQAMLTNKGFTLSASQANYFWYQYKDDSGIHYEQVMLLPYKAMGLLGKNVKVQYTTQLNDSQLSTEQTASNGVNLVVKYKPGQGPGPGETDDFGWTVKKEGTSHPELGSKSGLSYDEKTQKANWKIKVNFYGKDLSNVTVEDVLTDSDQILYPGEEITFTKWDVDKGTFSTGKITEKQEESTKPYYTLDKVSVPGETKIVFHLEDLEKNDWYDIRYSTQVVNTTFLSDQKPGKELNQAVIKAVLGPENKEYIAKTELPVDNTWITKSAVGTYDYANQLFSWKSTVNPNHLQITNAVVTDTVTNSELNTVTKAVRHPKSGNSEEATISISNGAGTIEFPGGFTINVTKDASGVSTFAFPADEMDDTFEFEYNTKLTNVTATPYTQDANARKQEVTNTIDLTGNHKEALVKVSAQAKNSMTLVPAIKDGKYAADDTGKITWNILVNRDKINMEGAVVKDDISTKPFFELDRINFAIYKAVLKADGSVDFAATTNGSGNRITENDVYKDAVVTGTNGTLAFDNGFTYTIPTSLSATPLLFVFDTYFIDSITDGDTVGNKVTVEKDSYKYETPESNGGFSGTFNIENYAGATKKPILLISKKSSNSQNTSERDNSLALEGAEFTLESYIKDSEAEGTYVFNTVTKSAFSQAAGNATYVNLKPDVVYKVWENKAPNGYELDNTPKYFLFLQKGTPLPTSIMIGEKDVINNCVIFRANSASQYKQVYPVAGEGSSPSFIITNTPAANNEIKFTKLGAGGSVLQGSEFTLTQQDGSQVKKISAISGADGTVTFSNVDVNVTYVLQEKTTADLGNDQGATFIVKTSWEGNKFSYTITEDPASNKTALVSGNSTEGYKIKNQYRTGQIVLKKVDAGGNKAALNGAGFKLYVLNADGNAIEGPAIKTTGSDSDGVIKSKDGGIITFSNVPYSPTGYGVVEVSIITGYKMPENTFFTKITASEVVNAATTVDSVSKQDNMKKPEFIIDKRGDSAATIKNERVTGKISLTKRQDNKDFDLLGGQTFRLYYIGTDGYYGSSVANSKVLVAEGTTSTEEATKGKLTFTKANKYETQNDPLVWGTYRLEEVLSGDSIYKPVTINILPSDIVGAISPTDDKTAHDASFDLTVKYGNQQDIVTNTLKTVKITLDKKVTASNSDGTYFNNDKMSGVRFTLSGKNAYGEAIASQVKETVNGTLTFTDVPISCEDGYTLTETYDSGSLANGYKKPKSYQVVVTSEDGQAKVTQITGVTDADTYGTCYVNPENAAKNVITVTNEPKTGSLQFTKKSVTGSGLTALNDSVLKDVYFVLGAVNDTVKAQVGNKEPVRIGSPVQSDANGTIAFDNVVYGQKYVLYEKVPAGYTRTAIGGYRNLTVSDSGGGNGTYVPVKEITSSNTTWNSDENGLNFTFQDAAVVNNTLRISDVTLKKVDENGSLLKDITFTIYRRNSAAIDTAGSGLVMEVPAETMSYYLYQPAGTAGVIKTGINDGQATLHLPYGDYVAVETLPDDIQSGNDVAVHITITADGSAVVKQTTQFHNTNVAVGTGESFYTLEGDALADTAYWKTTAPEAGDKTYTVVNKLKYGFVNLHKVSGDSLSGGTIEPSINAKLSDVEFNIYQADETGSYNSAPKYLFATVKTDLLGNIMRDIDAGNGKLLDTYGAKYLVYGTYYLVEKTPGDNHYKNSGVYKFEIGEGALEKPGTGHLGTAWICTDTNNGASYEVKYIKEGASAPTLSKDTVFVNEAIRGTFSLEKKSTDPSSEQIKDAEFTVFTKESGTDIPVAYLKYSEVSGKYELVPYRTSPVNLENIEYLTQYDSGQDEGEGTPAKPPVYKLLQGIYYLKETNIVPGYQENTPTVPFQVNNEGNIEVKSEEMTIPSLATTGSFAEWTIEAGKTAIVTIKNAPVKLTLTKEFISNNESPAAPSGDYDTVFGLYKEGTDGVVDSEPSYTAKVGNITSDSNISGRAVFTTIKDGTYILREKQAAQTHLPMSETYTVVVLNGKIKITDSKDEELPKGVVSGNDSGDVTLGDIKNYAKGMFSFQKIATDDEGADVALDGATFKLTKGETILTSVSATVSHTDGGETKGNVTFKNLETGTYILEEESTVAGYIVTNNKSRVVVDSAGQIAFYEITGGGENLLKSYQNQLKELFKNERTEITVIKKDDSSNNLEGVTLRIIPENDTSTLTKTNTADNNGYEWTTDEDNDAAAKLSGLLVGGGTYRIEEVEREEGYLLAAPIIFTYSKDGKITVLDNDNNEENGKSAIQTEGIPTGTIHNNTYTVAGDDITFVLLNKKIKNGITLTKTIPGDENGKYDYAGIAFDLYECNDTGEVGETPDADPQKDRKVNVTESLKLDIAGETAGTLSYSDLPEGWYYFVETQTKDTLCLNEIPTTPVYIGPDQDETKGELVEVSMENEAFNTAVKLEKVDAGDDNSTIGEAGDKIQGAEFVLNKIEDDGSTKTEIARTTTNDEGELTFTIQAKGKYEVVETKAAVGYVLDKDHPYTAAFEVDNTKNFQGEVLNLSEKRTKEDEEKVTEKYNLSVTGKVEAVEDYTGAGVANARAAGTVTLIKKSVDDESLNDVKFILYKKQKSENFFEYMKNLLTGKSYKQVDSVTWSEDTDAVNEDGALTISGLSWGDYYITESGQLAGYELDDTQYKFTIDSKTGTNISMLVSLGKITNAYTSVSIQKTNMDGVRLYGGVLKLEGDFQDGSTQYQWTTASEAETIVNKLITGEEYILSEVSAPGGYIQTKATATIKLNEDGTLVSVKGELMKSDGNLITVQNKPVTMAVHKYSPLGERLKGCVFAVTGVFAPDYSGKARMMSQSIRAAADDNVETLIVDDDHPDILKGRLIVGNIYTLQEQTPPNGYVVGGKVEFRVLEKGDIEMVSESTEYTLDQNTGRIVMVDDATTLGLAKTDEKGNYLGGAVYTVEGKFADGTDKKEFTPTADGALEIHELFIEGERYTLTETKAPKGYDALGEPVIFNFLERNGVEIVGAPDGMVSLTSETKQETIEKTTYAINIKNKKTPEKAQGPGNNPDKTVSGAAAKAVDTGDTADITNWAVLGAVAAAAMVLSLVLIRRHKKKE